MTTFTPREFANLLNGRLYGEEITKEEEAQAFNSGLVVVFGASDGLMELSGIVTDEISAYEGTTVYFNSEGLIQNECSDDDCPYFEKAKKAGVSLKQIWDKDGYSWIYETDIPHACFDILEGDELYCRGIVFALSDVQKTEESNVDQAGLIKSLSWLGIAGPDGLEDCAARQDYFVNCLIDAVLKSRLLRTQENNLSKS